MAGLIARLFGGASRPPDPDPLPGEGGYAMPPGPYGEGGFPGSTSVTRTFKGNNPRGFKVKATTNYGITPVTDARAEMQETPGTFYGGSMLRTGHLNDTAGANIPRLARATETPPTQREPQIARDIPGAANVRNKVAQRYKARPGEVRSYLSSPRGDLPPVNPGGQATDGNVHPERAVTPVTVPSRFVFAGGGNQTYYMLRQMPYTGRGDGARGADLNGTRYYATGAPEFLNASMGEYGSARLDGPLHRPTTFTEPAPWSANYYDTTESTGTSSDPGTGGQSPDAVYVSPGAGRASNRTGRRA